ncbi:homoserine kinase type II [Paenibacillus castaneae]|uniref:phosphotransferase n=1 Tax=Paenibacillus castaneae TaxID=474957 RepID=UPI000C9A008A|nr:phosphotransferase [Paenibacillus castaneae]NIK76694.1 homoserine kinase type II [Paenibacillus castaneae]
MDINYFLNEYEFSAPYEVEDRESGMNNTTRMVRAGSNRYVLRIYNNHKDANIVRIEHEVLTALQNKALSLPFQVPRPVRNKRGSTISVSQDGSLSSLFHFIEGERPHSSNSSHVLALGKAAASLTVALSRIEPACKPLYSPYYLLEDTYESMNSTAFIALSERSEALSARRDLFERLQEERLKVTQACAEISNLPKQWIHGDLVFNNTVSKGEEIVGVLDFEFSTIDVRAMELAVILVDTIRPDDAASTAKVKLLLQGYLEIVQLSKQEMEQLPSLMKLRLLDVALHFAVRLREGLDHENVLCGIIDQSNYGFDWINQYWEAELI